MIVGQISFKIVFLRIKISTFPEPWLIGIKIGLVAFTHGYIKTSLILPPNNAPYKPSRHRHRVRKWKDTLVGLRVDYFYFVSIGSDACGGQITNKVWCQIWINVKPLAKKKRHKAHVEKRFVSYFPSFPFVSAFAKHYRIKAISIGLAESLVKTIVELIYLCPYLEFHTK